MTTPATGLAELSHRTKIGTFVPLSAIENDMAPTVATLVELLAKLDRDDTLLHCGAINAIISGPGALTPLQREQKICAKICTPEDGAKLDAYVKTHGGPERVSVFLRGQMLELIRWASKHCSTFPNSGDTFKTYDACHTFMRAALIASEFWGKRTYADRLNGTDEVTIARDRALGAFRKGVEESGGATHMGVAFGRGKLLFCDYFPKRYLTQTSALKHEDFALMGKLIQNYCYVDLNARRIIDSIRLAALGPDERNGGSLQDAQVIPKLREAAEMLPQGNVREGVIKAADSIALHVRHRHNFAHWAARRIKEGDYFVMFTKNAKEIEKLLGTKPPPEVMTYGLVPIGPLHVELSILEKQGLYLAQAASWIDMDSAKYKSFFDQRKADQQRAKYEAGKTKRGATGPPPPD